MNRNPWGEMNVNDIPIENSPMTIRILENKSLCNVEITRLDNSVLWYCMSKFLPLNHMEW